MIHTISVFAALTLLCQVALSLPVRGWTAVAVVVLASLASIRVAARRRMRWPLALDVVAVGLPMLLLLSVLVHTAPFLSPGPNFGKMRA